MKKLNIFDLHEEINKKKACRMKSFDKILEICHTKIKNASEKEMKKVIYEVPEFVIGLPLYDVNKCIEYIIRSLIENGFIAKYFPPKIIYISWDLNEINNNGKPVTLENTSNRYIQNKNANSLIMKPSATKKLAHKPNGKFVLNID